MSACAALKRSISSFILLASIPCTGTGKNRSISIGSAAEAVRAIAAAAGIAIAAPKALRRVISVMCFPLLDAGKDEGRHETPLEDQKQDQQRCRDKERTGGDDAPGRAGLGARGECREP